MQLRTESLGRRCFWLALAIVGLLLLAILPARHAFGALGVEAAAVSALSCLVGGCVTFWFATRLTRPRMQAFAILFGTGIRGLFALIGALVMEGFFRIPRENYLIWLALFYLVSLALETALLMNPANGAGRG